MTATVLAPDVAPTLRILDEFFGPQGLANVGFRLWDGTSWPDDRPRPAVIVIKHPGALRQMFLAGTEKALGESFLRDDFDVEGDIETAFELVESLRDRPLPWRSRWRTGLQLRRLASRRPAAARARAFRPGGAAVHSPDRDRQAVTFHYDVSNDFYRLWLDERMVYSCAYFERPDLTLDQAQEAKLDLLCRKLRLRAGQHLLDIGCGWGGLAIFAAQRYGVYVTGITLSAPQAELATERARQAGVQARVNIERRDYRDLAPHLAYDAIVSVGMSEHVGRARLAEYFRTATARLRCGGVFLNHAIGEGVRPRRRAGPSFIEAYVFPDGDIPPLPYVLQAAEAAGLEIRDVENLREHYAQTLRRWVSRLENAHRDALQYIEEPTYRVWRAYMAGSAHGFACGQLAVYQVLFAKLAPDGTAAVPATRAYMLG